MNVKCRKAAMATYIYTYRVISHFHITSSLVILDARNIEEFDLIITNSSQDTTRAQKMFMRNKIPTQFLIMIKISRVGLI